MRKTALVMALLFTACDKVSPESSAVTAAVVPQILQRATYLAADGTQVETFPVTDKQARLIYTGPSVQSPFHQATAEFTVEVYADKKAHSYERYGQKSVSYCGVCLYDADERVIYFEDGDSARDDEGCPTKVDFTRPFKRIL